MLNFLHMYNLYRFITVQFKVMFSVNLCKFTVKVFVFDNV